MAPDAPRLYEDWPGQRGGSTRGTAPATRTPHSAAADVVWKARLRIAPHDHVADRAARLPRVVGPAGGASPSTPPARTRTSCGGCCRGSLRPRGEPDPGRDAPGRRQLRAQDAGPPGGDVVGAAVARSRRAGANGSRTARETPDGRGARAGAPVPGRRDADGRIVGFDDEIVADVGALTAQAGWGMPNMSATRAAVRLRGPGRARRAGHVVATNKPPLTAARGFGKDAAHFVMERAVDLVARAAGHGPGEVRAATYRCRRVPVPNRRRPATSTAATTRACSTWRSTPSTTRTCGAGRPRCAPGPATRDRARASS